MPAWLERLWYGDSALRWLLWPLSMVFVGIVELRRHAYRLGLLRVAPASLPVAVVGNLTVGGTGKTPLVLWLTEQLEACGERVGVVSRGYGGVRYKSPRQVSRQDKAADVGDEPLLIARQTSSPVVVCVNRARAVEYLQRLGVTVVISDDGLQHYAMPRQIELAVVDGIRGLGNGLCLPAGPLRERPARLREVDVVVVNGGDDVPARLPLARTLRHRIKPVELRELSGAARLPLEWLKGQSVHAVAGIGHPERFFTLLESLGASVIRHPLGDHAQLHDSDLHFDDGLPVIITAKDAMRCDDRPRADVWWLAVEVEFFPGQAELLLQQVRVACGLRGEG